MTWTLNFLWVLAVECIQNTPFMVGVVTGLSSIRRGLDWWKWSLMCVGSSYASAVAISSTEWIKVMPTTRIANPPDLLRMLYMGTIFSVACAFLVVYFVLTWRLKKPFLSDVAFGILIGTTTAIVQARNLPPMLVALHALSFAVASGSFVALSRYSAEVAPGRKMIAWISGITLVISILIVLFDYVPFLSRCLPATNCMP
jgi:hypothetical protein